MTAQEEAKILIFDVEPGSRSGQLGPLLRSGGVGEKIIKATEVFPIDCFITDSLKR